MRFWDSSALVPLIAEESLSGACRRILRADPTVAVWTLTRTEMVFALRRKERLGDLTREETRASLRRLELLAQRWTTIEAVGAVQERAERLLAGHPLAAADALQLGAALVLADDRPRGWTVVVVDERLGDAAETEGFGVTVPRA